MQRTKLFAAVMGSLFALPALAADAPHTISSNVSLVSNYLYRGVSQTGDRGAIQGGFDYVRSNGIYAGAWGSNISWLSDAGTASKASFELDTYIGFTKGFAEDFSYDVGFLRYNYPGEYALGAVKADTNELYGAIGWKGLKAKYSRSMTNLFGVDDSKGSTYAELNGNYSLENIGVDLGAHYGKQTVKGAANSGLTYSDYNIGASKNLGGYSFGLKISKTNITGDKATGVVSLSHSM